MSEKHEVYHANEELKRKIEAEADRRGQTISGFYRESARKELQREAHNDE
jgi:hypothetical protein